MKPNDLIEVICPKCNQKRNLKWSAYKNKKVGPPYVQQCRCWQVGKVISDEAKAKTSATLKGVPKSQEMKNKLRVYRLENPTKNLIPGQGAGWNKGIKNE